MSVSKMRRENLKHLADSRTQTKLASDLEHETLTQQIISSIIRGKRMLHDSEARYVEGKLGIPSGWIDKYPFGIRTLLLIREFKSLDATSKEITNKLLQFVESQKSSNG